MFWVVRARLLFLYAIWFILAAAIAAVVPVLAARVPSFAQRDQAALAVTLDAGHGGHDPGAVRGDVLEKRIVLAVARQAQAQMAALGMQVSMTREQDAALARGQRADLTQRVLIAGRAGADVMISLHADASPYMSVQGPRSYFQVGSTRGRRLADCIQMQLHAAAGVGWAAARPANYFVTRTSAMPAVLVELGFLSNPGEAGRLSTVAYQERLAQALAAGADAFAKGVTCT